MQDMKRLFLGSLDVRRLEKIVVVGGLPRSGTTSLDAALHACPSCFMCDEFHDLLLLEVRRFFNRLQNYHGNEGRHWLDAEGRTWRGMDAEDHTEATAYALSQTLLAFTNPAKFSGKHAIDIRVLGFKHPRIERGGQMFRNAFPFAETKFVYAAREPVAVLKSLWTMRWTREDDPQALMDRIIRDYEQSLGHLQTLVDREMECIVFRTGIDRVDDLLDRLDIQSAGEGKEWRVDTWPHDKRRDVGSMPEALIDTFSQHPTITGFRERMGLPTPS